MTLRRKVRKRMYAVSLDRVGLIAGTMSYSRRAAISHLLGENFSPTKWENCKSSGYRTVQCKVEVTLAVKDADSA